MFFDWIMGVALRPGDTYEKSRQHLRFGYWWIVLTAMTLESVMAIFRAKNGLGTEDWANSALTVSMMLLIMFDVQALMLLGAGRLLQWPVTWAEATKFCGLLWSILVLEDLFTFYPALKGFDYVEVWISAAFSLWYVGVMAIGVLRVSGLNAWRSLLVTALAGVTWRATIWALNYYSLVSQS